MTDHEPKHPPADMAGLDGLIERLRKARVWPDYSQSRVTIETAHEAATQLQALAARVKVLEAENERLRKLTCATWFYMPDEGDSCWFSPHEVIDEMYGPEPGNHVFEVECATSLPSIWCAVRVTDDPDAYERFTFTEHATEAEARAALGEKQ